MGVLEDKVYNLEMVVERISKKNSKQCVKGIITPYPISSACFGEVKGKILTYMFPCNGMITKGILKLVDKDSKANLTVTLENLSRVVKIDELVSETDYDLAVFAGDRLTVSIDSETSLSEVWIAFLWMPSMSEVEVKKAVFGLT